MFYSKSFIVFGLTFRSLIHFAYGVRESSNFILHFLHVVVQSLGGIQLFVNTQIEAPQGPLSFAIFWNLFKAISIKQVMPSIHLVLSRFLLLPPSTFPSIRAFSNESALHISWPKYCNFSFNINPYNEYSGLISFRVDWFDILEVQGTLKSLLQHHSSKASVLRHSALFIVQLSHPYMTTGKTIHSLDQTDLCW